jgi:hypothetical protein
MAELTQARLHEVLAYSPKTGHFTWRVTRGWKAPAGTRAGTPHARGYIALMVDQKLYLAHRLAWLYVYGVWPVHTIDHINGVRNNNRISNLRDVTIQSNLHNQSTPYKSNKSGLRGVSFEARSNKWYARIRVNTKSVMLGYFLTAQEAHAAYVSAKHLHHHMTKETK